MKIFSVILVTLFITYASADSTTGTGSFAVTTDNNQNDATIKKTIFKPSVTRTELKVSRSLNPDNVQTLNVRTNDGGLATIIVKKRDGKSSVNNEPRKAFYDVSNEFSRGEVRRGFFGPVRVIDDSQIQSLHQRQQQFESGRIHNNWVNAQPVTTLHQSQLYHRNPHESYRFTPPSPNDEKSVKLISSFMRHVQQIEGSRKVRSPDSSLPNDRAQILTKIPEPVTINSETVYVKDQNKKQGRSLLEIDSDGIPLINGIRVPDDENDKRQTWRNARVINGELVPYENGYVPPRTVEYGQLIYPVKKSEDDPPIRRKSIGPFNKSDNFSEENEEDDNSKSIGPFSVRDMFMSRRNQNLDGNIGPFSIADNSKTSNSKLIDYIKRINDQEYRKDYFAGRSPKDGGGQKKIQRRMLTQPGNVYFPPSSRYSTSSKPNDSNLAGPVLQYAHPEFGLQTVGSSSSSYEDHQQQAKNKQAQKVEYYSNNYQQRPNNQPIYQIEPASLNTKEFYNYPKTPATYPYNYGFIRRVKADRPLWVKISEQVRDTFQNGFTQVQQITRPVVEPIMEAGEKISQNLGFSYPVQNRIAQDKVSSVASIHGGTSYIFPALGMLAGGAALGLGAVAMGRIFDVGSILTMRSGDEQSDIANQRALEAIQTAPSTTLFLVENNGNEVHADNQEKSSARNYDTDMINIYSSPTSSKAKFLELIAIPYHSSIDSSIEPVEESQLNSHQRRKRNK
ncbi:CLUMA_CG017042, isoform A [Clunio marinus]|uniref:CLUMA_CG017042, isoform A n=1 Tax=Clunio marinus TaxID=568069 RepID=A0A1J1IZA6_9DIPT|nr:CLUMA_CG017042, isoform A [Clunio marinus]